MLKPITEFVLWAYDPRGAFREVESFSTVTAAENMAQLYTQWYIEERSRRLHAVSPAAREFFELPSPVNLPRSQS